jgi:hypothetical protein
MALLQKNGDLCLFCWFCYKEGDGNNVVAFLYGGTCKEGNGKAVFFFLFFLSLWFSSLELTINNEMVVFLMLKVTMATRRRLKKKGGGDSEVHK